MRGLPFMAVGLAALAWLAWVTVTHRVPLHELFFVVGVLLP